MPARGHLVWHRRPGVGVEVGAWGQMFNSISNIHDFEDAMLVHGLDLGLSISSAISNLVESVCGMAFESCYLLKPVL